MNRQIKLALVLASTTFAQYGMEGLGPTSYNQTSTDPVGGTVVSNVQRSVTQYSASPLFKSKATQLKSIVPVSSDYELEFFNQKTFIETSGMTHNIRAAYNWVSGDEKIELGGTFQEKMIVTSDQDAGMMGPAAKGASAFNHIFGIQGRYVALSNEKMRISAGALFDYMILSDEFKTLESTNGINFGINTVGQFWINDLTLVGGLTLQKSMIDKLGNLDLGTAFLVGKPFGDRISANLDLMYRITLSATQEVTEWKTELDSLGFTTSVPNGTSVQDVEFDDTPHSLSVGLMGTYLMSDAWGLNLGYRTQLLVKDYSSNSIVVGGRFAF